MRFLLLDKVLFLKEEHFDDDKNKFITIFEESTTNTVDYLSAFTQVIF